MPSVKLKDFLISVILALGGAIVPTVISLVVEIASLSGRVSYSVTENEKSFHLSISVENFADKPIDLKLAAGFQSVHILSTSRYIDFSVLSENWRSQSVITIRSVPGKSTVSALIGASKEGGDRRIHIIDDSGFSIRNLDEVRREIGWVQPVSAAVVTFLLVLGFALYEDRRLSEGREERKSLLKKVETLEEKAQEQLGIVNVRVDRIKIYYGKLIRVLKSENDFWRGIFRGVLINSRLAKFNSREVVALFWRRLGGNPEVPPEDLDIQELLDILVDELKSGKLGELSASGAFDPTADQKK